VADPYHTPPPGAGFPIYPAFPGPLCVCWPLQHLPCLDDRQTFVAGHLLLPLFFVHYGYLRFHLYWVVVVPTGLRATAPPGSWPTRLPLDRHLGIRVSALFRVCVPYLYMTVCSFSTPATRHTPPALPAFLGRRAFSFMVGGGLLTTYALPHYATPFSIP